MTRAKQFLRLTLAALALALWPALLFAQRERQVGGQGTEGFRALIASYRLRPLKTLRELDEAPERTLLIEFRGAEVRGQSDPLDTLPAIDDGINGFIDRGGAVLYASDQPSRGSWLADYGVTIDGKKLFCRKGSTVCYKGIVFCPFVDPRFDADVQLFQRRAGRLDEIRERTLDRVASNRPSFLSPGRSDLTVLATYQFPIRLETESVFREQPYAFAQGKRYDNGARVLVLADHSVFINEMLLPEAGDNDNLAFAANCLDWLIQGPNLSRRDRVLFIDQNGVIETDFNLALAMTELPPLPVDPSQIPDFLWANREWLWDHRHILSDLEDAGFFRELEQSNFFNDLLLSWQPHWVWIRFIVVVVTVMLLFLAVRRFFEARFRRAKNMSRLAVALDRYRPRVGLLEQRLRSAMSRGQAFEAAREKARQFFADFELTPADFGQTLPEMNIDAGWWQRRKLVRDMREAWRLGFVADPAPVSVRQWPAFLARLQNLRQAIRKGIIRFA